jgi:Ca2+-dependent lipid-binding protein
MSNLHIEAKSARYLHNTELFTKQDPYLQMWTSSTTAVKPILRTKTHFDGGREATWDESFIIALKDQKAEHLFVEVFDHNDVTSDRLVGKAKIACSDVGSEEVESWVKIYRDDGQDAGEVLLKLKIA